MVSNELNNSNNETIDRLRKTTEKLKNRLDRATPTMLFPKPSETPNKRLYESSSSLSPSNSSCQNTNTKQIKKKFRSVVSGLPEQNSSRQFVRYPQLQASSPKGNKGALLTNPDNYITNINRNDFPSEVTRKGEMNDPILTWFSKQTDQLNCIPAYDNSFDSPYLVLMESVKPEINIGRLNPTAIGKFVAVFIEGDRKIYISGRN